MLVSLKKYSQIVKLFIHQEIVVILFLYILKLFGSHKYSHNLKELAKYYNVHSETINFWKRYILIKYMISNMKNLLKILK